MMAMSARMQHGQSLTEFLVVSLAIIPLFLLVPYIGKYQDISHATQMASRYVAFDAMTRNDSAAGWKPEAQLAEEVRRRFFSNSDAPIKTGDVAGNFDAHRNLFWVDPNNNPLIENFQNDVQVSYGNGHGSTHADGFKAISDSASMALAGELGLRSRGVYTANVTVRLANLPAGLKAYEPFDQLNLVMERSTSLLVDPWTAQSPAQVEQKLLGSATMFPAGALASVASAVGNLVPVIEGPGGIPAPKLGQLEFWRDVVPDDRLKAGN